MRYLNPLMRLPAMAATAMAAGSTIQLLWNTGFDCFKDICNPLGPDGPWQGLQVDIGGNGDSVYASLYPSVTNYYNTILTKSVGGDYVPDQSSSANKSTIRVTTDDAKDPFSLGPEYTDEDVNATAYLDFINVSSEQKSYRLNSTVFAVEEWSIKLHNGSQYRPSVGYLGLGPSPDKGRLEASNSQPPPDSLLDGLKRQGDIQSRSFGLHMGSAKLKQVGSLVLGGYDQSRALGEVSAWPLSEEKPFFLLDVMLGVEEGGSPFADTTITKDEPKSAWKGVGDNKDVQDLLKGLGAPSGSACVSPISTLPSIYLPPGNCEAIAKALPVTWDKDIEYYLWNESDPLYKQIVSSPAFLSFVLATHDSSNITIKLPFPLLDLTLESPIVDKPKLYFPCHSVNATGGVWVLGRAFLQGAFWGMNYDDDAVYLAQAPGPDLEQSVLRTMTADGGKMSSNPASSFAKTWQAHWTALPDNSTSHAKHGLSAGAIAGIVVGVVVLVAGVAALILFRWKRQSRRRGAGHGNSERRHEGSDKEIVSDTGDSPSRTHEVQGSERFPQELNAPLIVHELQDTSRSQELPGDRPVRDID